MYVSACVFLDGVHFPGPDCPHGPGKNELGEDSPPPGWTVQQADQEGHHEPQPERSPRRGAA